MDDLMRRSRRWAVMAGTAFAGMALSVAALAGPRDQGTPGIPLAYAPGAGFEAGSVLLTAPRSGAPILIWSQDDGYTRKLVWSRFVGNHWSTPRPMTFGSGDDLAPVAGVSSTGSVLYWVDDRGRVFYVPFDPDSGSLHAVPRPVTLAGRLGTDPQPEGGSEVPIILSNCDVPNPTDPCIPTTPTGGGGGTTGVPPRISPNGGTDAPIQTSTGTTSTNSLAVASHAGCGSQVLATVTEDSVSVMAFDGAGRSALLGQFRLHANVDRAAAASALAAHFLRQTCR